MDLKQLTDRELDREIEKYKSISERLVEGWAYEIGLNKEKLCRLKADLKHSEEEYGNRK